MQIVVAATTAYVFAVFVLGHSAPLLAATVTVSSLGLVRDARPRRVLDSVIGMLLGIAVAEVLLTIAGAGWWQAALTLAVTLVVARALSANPTFAIAAAIQALIVIIVPAEAPFLRLVDGIVGGVAALAVTALIPRNTIVPAARDGRALFAAVDSALTATIQGLRRGDRLRGERALEKSRAIGPLIDAWRASLESGRAVARISPFLRTQRFELARQDDMAAAMDLVVRNLRSIARRAAVESGDGKPRDAMADLLTDIARGIRLIGDSLDDIEAVPAARALLQSIATRVDPTRVLPGAGLSDQHLIALLRPMVIDALAATGLTTEQARAAMPRID